MPKIIITICGTIIIVYIVEGKIKDIVESGRKYAVYGVVVHFDKETGKGVLDDGEKTLEFVLNNFIYADRVKESSHVRLIGRGEIKEGKRVLYVDIVHTLDIPYKHFTDLIQMERRLRE